MFTWLPWATITKRYLLLACQDFKRLFVEPSYNYSCHRVLYHTDHLTWHLSFLHGYSIRNIGLIPSQHISLGHGRQQRECKATLRETFLHVDTDESLVCFPPPTASKTRAGFSPESFGRDFIVRQQCPQWHYASSPVDRWP
jgi:hypothetical protein